MKTAAQLALDAASVRGVTYADARVVSIRNRSLTTKNGRMGHASESESLGIGVRVIAEGAWGFAASADLSRAAVEVAAARAVEIARASEWTTPHEIDPFTVSVEQNIDLLLKIDAELRSVAGVTLAEANMNFRREEQWFFSSEGSSIHQTKYTAGAGYAAYAFAGNEIQKRSYPKFIWRAVAKQGLRTD
jgi:TldD protein